MKAFQSPNKYVQHKGALKSTGYHIKQVFPELRKSGIIMPGHLVNKYEDVLTSSLNEYSLYSFDGECSYKNMTEMMKHFSSENVDHIIAFGGGKILDIGKLVSHKMKTPSIIVPSLASTDAPCTALSVVYKETGEFEEYKFFEKNPDMVIVDTQVIADAPVRYLVAGMGDALSTYYETAACFANPKATNLIYPFTYRPSKISVGIAKQCLDTVISHGIRAKLDCIKHEVTETLEELIEANILMSGLGAESGGLALAHGLHNALTMFPESHHYLHGEKVAYGTIVQLMAQQQFIEALRIGKFCYAVGLPTSLSELDIDPTKENIEKLAELCLAPDNTSWNLGINLTKEHMIKSIERANNLISRL